MKSFLLSLVAISSLLSIGCTHLASVSTTSIPVERSQKVKVERSRFIFLALNFNNTYVDGLTDELARQCPEGKIHGILTKHENIVYFPIIAHAVRVTAEGYCNTPSSKPRSNG